MLIAGVDIGIHSVHYALFRNGELLSAHTVASNMPTRNSELFHIGSVIGQALFPCERVFIENTLVGNNIKYSIQLSEVAGAVMAHLPYCRVLQVNVGTWKKQVIGNGSASKSDVTMWLEENFPTYAAECDSQDQRDAVCIGLYGHGLGTTSESIAEALAG